MKISEAKKRIEEYQEYIRLFDDYIPHDLQQRAIKLYAELEHVVKVANELNNLGFRLPGSKEGSQRKIMSNDVTGLIDTKPIVSDKLHFIVRRHLNKNRGRYRG